jgi:hypothetical protein
MVKNILISFMSILMLCGFTGDGRHELKRTGHKAFQAGEKLVFSLGYSFISAGEAIMSVEDTVLNGKRVLHLVTEGKTVGLADLIYKVRDVYESFIDPETDMPVKAIRNIKEGGYRYYNEVTYNRDSSTVFSMKSGVKPVPAEIMDIISAFYYARNHYFNETMKVGDVISFKTYFSDKLFPLDIQYVGTEKVRTRFGKIECYKFIPVTEVGRAFKSKEGMFMWITKDKNRIPVKVKFELVVGSFVCNLESFEGLKYPFSSIVY